jgi:hypothetical protein
MKSVGEIIGERQSHETDEAYQKRCEDVSRKFKAVFNNAAGFEVLRLLYSASHPMAPRFGEGRTNEEAAYLDGERGLIAFLWLNGTNQKTIDL